MGSKGNKSSVLRSCKSHQKGAFLTVILLLIFFVATACVGFLLMNSSPRVESSVRFVSILHRHGERAPILTYPLDPYKDAAFWADGPEQLLQIIRVLKPCPLMSKEQEIVNDAIQKKLDENKDLLTYISKSTGLQVETIQNIDDIHDNLLISEQRGFKVPEWAREIYPKKLQELAAINYFQLYDTPLLRKLRSGILINDILDSMWKKINASEKFERRMNIFSAHDTTLGRLWQAIDISEDLGLEKPIYGSALIFELHETSTSKYRVKILYKRGMLDRDMTVLHIKGCEGDPMAHQDGMCDLDTFSSALEPKAFSDYDKECKIP
ncbi:lysosomal acid phosphatase isoform X2 [Bemisia tabaci]|uniref:lysosomal acid phosphatase isoform X2 n=1 Tax=Bemisia tabaci TaxID=7038 RepID=UPI003B27BF28